MKYGVEISLTDKCNAKCSYCYQYRNNNSMSREILENIIINSINDDNFNNEVYFFGGEPTLEYDNMNYIMNKYNNLNYHIVTNGLMLKNLPIIFLNKFKLIVISIEVNNTDSKNNRLIDDLYSHIDWCINNIDTKLIFQIVIGDYILDKLDDLIKLDNYISKHNKYLRFIKDLKPSYLIDSNIFIDKMNYLKNTNIEIYKKFLNYTTNWLIDIKHGNKIKYCDLENKVHYNTKGNIIPCAQYNLSENDYESKSTNILDDYNNILKTFGNHTLNKNICDCDNCFISKIITSCGMCSAVYNNVNKDMISKICERNRILMKLKLELINLGEVPHERKL